MRIPFDLIAVILCAERIGDYLSHDDSPLPAASTIIWVWLVFFIGSWSFHEIAARLMERRTNYGESPDGGGVGMHPLQFHGRCALAAQFLSVALFAWAIWYLKWPLAVAQWPSWFGMSADAGIGNLQFSKSVVATTLLSIGPYLAAMVLSWIPRRRLASGVRRRMIPLFSYLSFEAKLTWLPLSLCAALSVLTDFGQMLPKNYTSWLENEMLQSALILGISAVSALILVPLAAVKLWKCEPMPEGELKDRMTRLMERSGVKARAILVWGERSSGMLNACVMGPWSRFRYVLISPLLVDELSLDETEAVLGHELGHARYGHLTFYFVVILCMALVIDPLYNAVAHEWNAFPILQVGMTMSFVIGYIYFFFGALSRQCEREADLASAELVGTPQPLITALEKIARRNGNMRAVPCWHHGSIAERIVQVLRLSGDPQESVRFHARLKTLRIALMAFVALLIAAELILHR